MSKPPRHLKSYHSINRPKCEEMQKTKTRLTIIINCCTFVEIIRTRMAKPINITPILRGKQASKFFNKLKANSQTMPIKSHMREIESDAKMLRSITKAY